MIDVSDPVRPRQVASLTNLFAQDVVIQGNYAYLTTGLDGLAVVDIADPTHPKQVGALRFPESGFYATHVAVSERLACVAGYAGGLAVVDISDPANPRSVGTYEAVNPITVSMDGNYALVGGLTRGQGVLEVIDISEPDKRNQVSRLEMDVVPKSIVLHGKLLFCLGSGDTELRVIDLSDPALPKQVGSYNTGSSGTSMAIAQDYLFIADHYRGVQVFDITVPATPQLLGVYATEGSASSLVLQGDYAFLADGTALEVINIADPGRPTRGARLKMAAREVTAVPNYAYVVTSDLEIIDISSPTNPQKVGSYTTPGGVLSFAVAGTYGFVGTDHGLEIIDLSNPGAPHKVGSFAGERTYSVAVNGNHAFASLSEQNGFLALDISDVAIPNEPPFSLLRPPSVTSLSPKEKPTLASFASLEL